MQLLHDAIGPSARGAFDGGGVLVDANPEFFAGNGSRQEMRGLRNASIIPQALSCFRSFDGRPISRPLSSCCALLSVGMEPMPLPLKPRRSTADGSC